MTSGQIFQIILLPVKEQLYKKNTKKKNRMPKQDESTGRGSLLIGASYDNIEMPARASPSAEPEDANSDKGQSTSSYGSVKTPS